MRHVVADVETDGLLEDLTKLHCLVLRDLDTDAVMSCTDQPGYPSIADGLAALEKAERIYGHNWIGFDYPAIRKVYPTFTLSHAVIKDTQLIAQMRWAHIKKIDFSKGSFPKRLAGSHKLEAWGWRLGVYKGEYTDWCKANGIEDPWAKWSPQMQVYCEGDTATTKALVEHIRKFAPTAESMEIEHELAWYLSAQERGGIPFDMEKAAVLQGQWVKRRQELTDLLVAEFGPRPKKNGKESVPKKDQKKRGVVAGCAYQNIKWEDFNPGSRHDIAFHLKHSFGWVPTEFTDSGQPEVNEKTLKGLNAEIPAVKFLMEYLLITKRLGQLAEGKEAWFLHAKDTGLWGGKITGLHHIHGRIKQNHAITHRASHASPNMSAVPKVGKPFGEECRDLFYVPDGWVLVGADASGLEARNLAHYLARYDDGAYGRLMLEGDVHTENRKSLELPADTELMAKVARDGSKTWFYAWMYGGGPEKLGALLAYLALPDGTRLFPIPEGGWTKDRLVALGTKCAKSFLKNTPAFKHLISAVKPKAKDPGYVLMPDGRRAYIRSEHSALNTLLQGAGAIIIKRWIANFSPILWATLGEPGWNREWTPCLWSHDEVQIAVREYHAEWLCKLLVSEIEKVGVHYEWRLPLTGEAKVGKTWASTH